MNEWNQSFTCCTLTKRREHPATSQQHINLGDFTFQIRRYYTVLINLLASSLCIAKWNTPLYKLVEPLQSGDINRGSFVIGGQLSGQVANQQPFVVRRRRCGELLDQTCGCAFNFWCRSTPWGPQLEQWLGLSDICCLTLVCIVLHELHNTCAKTQRKIHC